MLKIMTSTGGILPTENCLSFVYWKEGKETLIVTGHISDNSF